MMAMVRRIMQCVRPSDVHFVTFNCCQATLCLYQTFDKVVISEQRQAIKAPHTLDMSMNIRNMSWEGRVGFVLCIGDGCKWSQVKVGLALQQYYDNSFDVGMQHEWGHREDPCAQQGHQVGTKPGPAHTELHPSQKQWFSFAPILYSSISILIFESMGVSAKRKE